MDNCIGRLHFYVQHLLGPNWISLRKQAIFCLAKPRPDIHLGSSCWKSIGKNKRILLECLIDWHIWIIWIFHWSPNFSICANCKQRDLLQCNTSCISELVSYFCWYSLGYIWRLLPTKYLWYCCLACVLSCCSIYNDCIKWDSNLSLDDEKPLGWL